MSLVALFFDFILHLDTHLASIMHQYGTWTYAILFVILFLETGFVLTPYLPGDSLIFAVGALAATGSLNLWILLLLMSCAVILGDSLNYAIGQFIGPRVLKKDYALLNRKALDKTSAFFDKHGGKTIILARFIPIIRTFAPFLAGVGSMKYSKFLAYNIIGGILWVSLFLFSGYFFGNIPFVKENFSLVILGIIVISLIPLAIEATKYYLEMREQKKHAKKN